MLRIMLRVGLTGGIGAGKSTVSRSWAQHGAVVVDADLIAREVVAAGTDGLARVVDEFGADVLDADGTLNRPALAAKVFGDNDARATLNAVLHPLIGARTAELVSAAPTDAVVVQDIPLLVEGGMAPMFHLVVVVHADEDERVRRLVSQRGMTEPDARARINAQADDDQRRAAADVWLDNSGAPNALADCVEQLWTQRLVPFERNLRLRTPVGPTTPVLVAADDTWAAQARRLMDRLRTASGERALRVDHVGSTAVPALAAKDVIDLQVTVASLAEADALAQPLADAGFPPRPEIVRDIPKTVDANPARWHKRLHNGADPARPVNVHLRVDGSPGQRFALVFRDWLRAEPRMAAEYLRVKRAAAQSARTVAAYADAKELWFEAVYPPALQWAAETGWAAGEEGTSAT